ncbi:MAG: AraC family transcriptional regulator [Cyanobacteria bacterium P01_C01_bin.118]
MAIRFFNQKSDYLHCGSSDDPRLFHADSSDQIQIWSPQVGQGYTQTIPLREGLSLVVMDYSVHSTFLYKNSRCSPFLEFEFQIEGPASGQSAFVPHLVQHDSFGIRSVQPRQLKVEILFSAPMFKTCAHTVVEYFPPQDRAMLHDWASWVYRSQHGYDAKSPQAAFDQILSGTIASPQVFSANDPFESLDFCAFGRFWRSMTSEMHQLVNQILSCPHGGQTRRVYLEDKALELVASMLQGMDHLEAISYPLVGDDLDRIYQAGRILARNLNNPPSVKALARQVGLNRFKLNQGFHQVYGTTPFRYLRYCRLDLAAHLLTTSDLAIEAIAHKVGYTSRSNFATAFRQQFGLNPKALQLHSRYMTEPQSRAS